MDIYAFVGPSGTGKSHRAQMVARDRNIECIIDDALLIKGNQVIAGVSAKKASTKIESVKKALFSMPGQAEEVQKAVKKYKPKSILILGTSDDMVEKIVHNLKFPAIKETIYIQEVSTPEEIETARSIRMGEGKHVIPVPTFEIKKDFSGYLLDPLQIFKWKGKGSEPFMAEKSIIRPTFSYLGNYTISDQVFRTILEYVASGIAGIYKVSKTRIESYPDGITIYVEVVLEYGYQLLSVMKELREKLKKEIDRLTTVNILEVQMLAKGLYLPEEKNIVRVSNKEAKNEGE